MKDECVAGPKATWGKHMVANALLNKLFARQRIYEIDVYRDAVNHFLINGVTLYLGAEKALRRPAVSQAKALQLHELQCLARQQQRWCREALPPSLQRQGRRSSDGLLMLQALRVQPL